MSCIRTKANQEHSFTEPFETLVWLALHTEAPALNATVLYANISLLGAMILPANP